MKTTKGLLVFSVFLILFGTAVVAVDCITPVNGGVIDSSAAICSGEHLLQSGIHIIGTGVTVTCQEGTLLKGDGYGTGIFIDGEDIIVNGCLFEGYETNMDYAFGGRVFFPSGDITAETSEPADVPIVENDPVLHVTDEDSSDPNKKNKEDIILTDIELPPKGRDVNFGGIWDDNVATPGLYFDYGIPKEDLVNVKIQRKYDKADDGLIVTTKIDPVDGRYTIYEIIPKEVVRKTKAPVFDINSPFMTAVEDPVKIAFDIDLQRGFTFSYKVDRYDRSEEIMTLVTSEKASEVIPRFAPLENNTSRNRVFHLVVVLFFIVSYHMERMVGRKK